MNEDFPDQQFHGERSQYNPELIGPVSINEIRDSAFHLQWSFSNEVSAAMDMRGMSREQLATRMGVDAGRLTQILIGGENWTKDTISAVGAALRAKITYDFELFEGENSSSSPQD